MINQDGIMVTSLGKRAVLTAVSCPIADEMNAL
jgi:hypothetical protein